MAPREGHDVEGSRVLLVDHYGAGGDVGATVLAALRDAGLAEGDTLDPESLAGVEEFHLGGRLATNALADRLDLSSRDRVLDVGCGIGGTARTLARRFGCKVLGVDLTPGLVATATTLSERTRLNDLTTFRVADATTLDESDEAFDAVTMVHVGMNVADKDQLLAELARVLRIGGSMVVYDIMRLAPGRLSWPMPWSTTPATSFLAGPSTYRDAMVAAGLAVSTTTDRRPLVREALAATAASPPSLHLGHLMGPAFPTMFANLRAAMDEGLVAPVELVATRYRGRRRRRGAVRAR